MFIQRIFQVQALFLVGTVLLGSVLLGSVAYADTPRFVKDSLHAPNAAPVAKVLPTLEADLVVLSGGLEQGIRLGMVCLVSRGFQVVGEIIIIESRSHYAAGLILELSQDYFIQVGDIARVKTLQTS